MCMCVYVHTIQYNAHIIHAYVMHANRNMCLDMHSHLHMCSDVLLLICIQCMHLSNVCTYIYAYKFILYNVHIIIAYIYICYICPCEHVHAKFFIKTILQEHYAKDYLHRKPYIGFNK